MIIDKQLTFSDAQAVTDAAVVSTNVIDLGLAEQNLGVGEGMYVVVQVDVAMQGANVTNVVTLQSDSAETQDSAVVTHQTIGTFPAASAAGTRFIARIQPGSMKQYLAVKYTPTGGAGELTAGKFSAFLVKDVDQFRAYADNITIS